MKKITQQLVCLLFLFSGASALADEQKTATLCVSIDGYLPDEAKWLGKYATSLASKLREKGFTLVSNTGERDECQTAEGMEKMVRRLNVDLVMSAQIINDRQIPPGYKLDIHLYQRGTKLPYQSQQERCERCTELAVQQKLLKLVDAMLIPQLNTLPTPQSTITEFPTAASTKTKTNSSTWKKSMPWLGLGLTIASAVPLSLAIWQANLDGDFSCMPQCGQYNTRAATIGLFVTTGALLIPGIVLMAKGWKHSGTRVNSTENY